MLEAFAEGWEAMAAVAAASHPALYDGGWHPTAVCGPVGAAVAAGRLLDLSAQEREHAVALALLRAGGTRGAFGSHGKPIQVGLAAAAGVQAALLARAGAVVDARVIHGEVGFERSAGRGHAPRRSPMARGAGRGTGPAASIATGSSCTPAAWAPTRPSTQPPRRAMPATGPAGR